jgi:hypothetical protein
MMGRPDAAGVGADDNMVRKRGMHTLSGKQRLMHAESQATDSEEIEKTQANVRFEDNVYRKTSDKQILAKVHTDYEACQRIDAPRYQNKKVCDNDGGNDPGNQYSARTICNQAGIQVAIGATISMTKSGSRVNCIGWRKTRWQDDSNPGYLTSVTCCAEAAPTAAPTTSAPTSAPTQGGPAYSEHGGVGIFYEMLYNTNCGGDEIRTWSSGESSLYGQAGLSESMDLYQCKKTCWDQSECAGFFWKPFEQRCSYWRQGPLRPSTDTTGNCLVKRSEVCDWPHGAPRAPRDRTLSCGSGNHEVEEVCLGLYQAPKATTTEGSQTDEPPCYVCKWTSNRRRSCQKAESECLCKSAMQRTHYGPDSL